MNITAIPREGATPSGATVGTIVFEGHDGAVVIEIQTDFEPDEVPFRVWLNGQCLHDSSGAAE